jgi:DNA-binding NtrC family response regulator
VVDDEPDVLRLIEKILKDMGHSVALAGSADQAIQIYDEMQTKPDLLLTDVIMPGLSGPMLVDRLLERQPDLRVLFVSGYDDRQVVQNYTTRHGFALLPKPFTLDRLSAKVQEILQGSTSEPQS